MGIASISPGVDFTVLGCAIAFHQHSSERGQAPLDLQKISIRDLLPLCFEWRLQLDPKRFELLLIHVALLSRVIGYKRSYGMTDAHRLNTITALVKDSGSGPHNVQQPIGALA
jgi:hypothetical protein